MKTADEIRRGREMFDNAAWHHLQMSGDEFMAKWEAGEFDVDGPQHSDIMSVAMMMPFYSPAQNPSQGGCR